MEVVQFVTADQNSFKYIFKNVLKICRIRCARKIHIFKFRLRLEMQKYLQSWINLSCQFATHAATEGRQPPSTQHPPPPAQHTVAGGQRPPLVAAARRAVPGGAQAPGAWQAAPAARGRAGSENIWKIHEQ